MNIYRELGNHNHFLMGYQPEEDPNGTKLAEVETRLGSLKGHLTNRTSLLTEDVRYRLKGLDSMMEKARQKRTQTQNL